MTFLTSVVVVELIAIVLMALAMAGLIRQVRFLTVGVGATLTRASPDTVDGFVGRSVSSIPGLPQADGLASVILFATGDCQVCGERFADLESLAMERPDVNFAVVLQGRTERFSSSRISVLQDRREVFAELNIPVTPFGVVVGRDGRITEARPLGTARAVQELMHATEEVDAR